MQTSVTDKDDNHLTLVDKLKESKSYWRKTTAAGMKHVSVLKSDD